MSTIRKNLKVRVTTLKEQDYDPEVAAMTPAERISFVWTVTEAGWAFTGKPLAERLPRHVVRVCRRER